MFKQKRVKLRLSLVVLLVFASINLCFLNFLDSDENYNGNISTNTTFMTRDDKLELQSKIVRWGEVMANNTYLINLDNVISYPDDATVKVREDNKIEFIVKRDTKEFSPETKDFLLKHNVDFYEDIPYFNASIIYASVEDIGDFISESESTLGITYTEPNFYIDLDFVPNDEYYESDQWDLSLIGMESAWEYEFGSHDVVVAVVDTGIDYTHPDLSENYLSLGYDWVNNDTDPIDDHYHGTHCAGTIAAVINNSIGVAGMANVSIFAEKAFNAGGSGAHSDIRLALMHAVDMGADIISCSWGGENSETLREGIDYVLNNDVMIIAAAGNDNSRSKHYPAAYSEVISVSATDQNDQKAEFSNYGDWIDISAPGVNIASTVPYEILGYYYGYASGTSMATPHVSGLAALIMSCFPNNNIKQIEAFMYETALDLGESGIDPYYGYGRIDATTIFGPDNNPPIYLNLIESADPLILGNSEIISVDVFDMSGINQVLIQFEDSNHSMTHNGGDTWQYSSWTPSSYGTYIYTIFMEDNNNNWGAVNGSIQVFDGNNDYTPPTYSNLIESADPLVLGDTEIISIDVTDPNGVSKVEIKCEGVYRQMENIGGDTWQYDSWTPSNTGNFTYIIYMKDNCGNWGTVSGSIQVVEAENDYTPPTYSNLVESSDPLELGNTEIISIDVTDPSGINQVLIEFEDLNHTMTNIVGITWQYDSWTPSSTGIYKYVIYMEDNYNNWGYVVGSINTKNDATPPNYLNLIESADPLELGNTEIISIDVIDPSGIKQVLIEFEGSNHSMMYIADETWEYAFWTPLSTDNYQYKIYMEDNYNNWGFVSGSIQVVDTTLPTCTLLTNHSEPIELGNSTVIMIKATDNSGIKQVIIKYEGSNYVMRDIGGDVWQFKKFSPSKLGICNYTIYVEDFNNNWESISNSVEIVDTQAPNPPVLMTFPTGNVSTPIIFDWEDGDDPSGIKFYRLIIDTEVNPFLTQGFIFEVNISNTGSKSSYFELKESLPLGTYYFFVYQIDGAGHQSTSTTGTFTIILPTNEGGNKGIIRLTPILFYIFIIGSIVAVPSYVVRKRKKKGKSKILITKFETKHYESEIKELNKKKRQLEKIAEAAVKYSDFTKATELYEGCESLSNQLFKKGALTEAENTKYYANMRSKASKIEEQRVSFVSFMINELLTKYFDSIRVKYYSDSQIYNNGQKILNGWILNDTKFLQYRLTNPQNGLDLVRELGFYVEGLSEITVVQLIYTGDLSYDSIIDICKEHQNPGVITFIIGINWPSTYQHRHSFSPPEDFNIKYRENIRIIDCDLFASFIGLEGKYKDQFSKAIKSYMRSKI